MIRIDYPDGSIGLRPETPNEWLWKDHTEDVKRQFVPSVGTTPDCEPYWHECTDMARIDYEAWWERQHPQPEPEPSPEPAPEPEPEDQPIEKEE